MKLSFAIVVASLASVNGLAPNGRRAFLSKVATSAASVAVAAPAFAKEEYSLDFDKSIVAKKEAAPAKSGNGGSLVGGALAGGFALSLPFFAPNLARLAGYKNAKQPSDKAAAKNTKKPVKNVKPAAKKPVKNAKQPAKTFRR